MPIRSKINSLLGSTLRQCPTVWKMVRGADEMYEKMKFSAADYLPSLSAPDPRQLAIAITARCNLSCMGCRYGRDFMSGSELSLQMVLDAIDDAGECGFREVRLYGGEPLLHRELPAMVQRVVQQGMRPYVTTNAILLERNIDALFSAGLRVINVGFYGVGAKYESYVQKNKVFDQVERGIAATRDRYGEEINMRVNWLIMRPSCNLQDLDDACRFAEKYKLRIQLDLVHYSLPYFTEGPERELQFRPEDRPQIESVVAELLRRQREQPGLFFHSPTAIAAIPDWLLKGPRMQVPCDANKLVWIGADGSVQLCYVTFSLGSLHEQRLREMVFSDKHQRASRDAHALVCPNCHCGYDTRTDRHFTTARRYRPR